MDIKDESMNKKREFSILMALKQGYETGEFENVTAYLTDSSIFESQWVLEPLVGKTDIMTYLRGKGETLKKYNALAFGDFIVYPGGIFLRLTQKDDDKVNEPIAIVTELDDEGMVSRIDLCDIRLFLDESEINQGE